MVLKIYPNARARTTHLTTRPRTGTATARHTPSGLCVLELPISVDSPLAAVVTAPRGAQVGSLSSISHLPFPRPLLCPPQGLGAHPVVPALCVGDLDSARVSDVFCAALFPRLLLACSAPRLSAFLGTTLTRLGRLPGSDAPTSSQTRGAAPSALPPAQFRMFPILRREGAPCVPPICCARFYILTVATALHSSSVADLDHDLCTIASLSS